ncbi:MAG: alpha-amylase family glycosyl hydrolase [Candidatus Amulumruptor caecigallinarius]|nr:alpha-amylase family glycosyl hydrolase [Candidatus Amulumruptor caecigallinarius]
MKFTNIFALLLGMASIIPASAEKSTAITGSVAESPVPDWLPSAVIYEANLRQGTPTRDLKGLQRRLPFLKDMGVDVIWLMPIHPISKEQRKGELGSYYAVQDYKAVNPEFGTMEDLKEFVRTAHGYGMKVILDEVCNHTGADHAWVKEHPDYYARNEKGEMYGPYDWTDVFKLDYTNPDTRAAMTDALAFWVKEADIDGYRCDVAGEVLTDFWEEVRPKLQEIKPVMMLAEASKPELMLKAFDADYAWPMKDVFCAIAMTKGVNKHAVEKNEKRPSMTASDIPALLERQSKEYPAGSIHMNMITNHDLNSWEGTEFERFGPATGAFAVLSYTLPGIPMMYTGQEVGFNHALEFFDRDPIMPSQEANEFTTFYEVLNALKHKNRALDARSPIEFIKSVNPDVLTFVRSNGDDKVMTIVNLSNDDVELKYQTPVNIDGYTNYFTGSKAEYPARLAPWQYLVFTSDKITQ